MSIQDYLRASNIRFEVLLHRPESTATRRAKSIHVAGRSVAKGVLLTCDRGYVLAVLPATHRIDLQRLARLLSVERVLLALEDELELVFHDCQRGAVPAFGRMYGLQTIVDANLVRGAEIVVDGNTRHEGLRIRYRDFEKLEQPLRGRFASFSPSGRDPVHRKAS